MEEKNRGDKILDQIAKTILIIILIFGLMILCGYLYLRSFAKRIIESERASMPTQTTVRPIDTDGWNYVDKDTMDYMRERRATEETRATQTSYSLTDEEINELLYGGHLYGPDNKDNSSCNRNTGSNCCDLFLRISFLGDFVPVS